MSGRVFILTFVFFLGVALGHYALETKPPAWGAPPAHRAGDLNGDESVDVTDAVYLLRHLFADGPAPVEASSARTVVFLVRHAERETDELNEIGRMRADHLATLFEHTKLDALIATDLIRTRQTIEPLAAAQAAMGNPLEIRITDATAAATVEAIRALSPGSTAVAAGHSFTIMSVIQTLGATETRLPFPSSEYDNVWVLTLEAGGEAAVVPLKYHVQCPDPVPEEG